MALLQVEAVSVVEDKILRLIRREGLASPADCGMIDVPQMNRQSERSAFENNLCVKARLEIISPHPAEVLDQKMFYLPGLNVGNQPFPCGTVKIAGFQSEHFY